MIEVKAYHQKAGHCGPSSLKMVLGYYGVEKTESELGKLVKCRPLIGTSVDNLIKTAKKLGFEAFYKDFADIRDLRFYLRKKVPVIVNWFSVCEDHYSVVVDVDKENIYLQDPEFGHIRSMKIGYFKKIWFGIRGDLLNTKDDIVIRRMIVIERKKP